ncbi:hypothetical protein MTO96_001403 [Rhipicephalus appendiculatus]
MSRLRSAVDQPLSTRSINKCCKAARSFVRRIRTGGCAVVSAHTPLASLAVPCILSGVERGRRRDVQRSRPRIRRAPLERPPLVTLFAHPFPARETTRLVADGAAAAACSNIGPAGGATYRVPDPPRGALGTRRELRSLPVELLAGRSLPQTGYPDRLAEDARQRHDVEDEERRSLTLRGGPSCIR